MDFHELSLAQLASLIHKGEISPQEVTRNILDRIESLNKTYNAYTHIDFDGALSDAKIAEIDLRNGAKGPLHGIPISVKDNISVKHMPTTNGFTAEVQPSSNDAAIITSLRAFGAIIAGKTNMDEFADHVVGENNTFGYVKNPVKAGYTTGGSSSGSAASVAANLSYGSLGTDTSGSVRIPASCCGVVGLKPTYGLLPMQGITPLSWSFDHTGVLARDIDDTSILFHSLLPGKRESGIDDLLIAPNGIKDLIIGVPENYFFTDVEEEVKTTILKAIEKLEKHGARLVPFTLNSLDNFMGAHYTIAATEGGYSQEEILQNHGEKLESFNRELFTYGLQIPKSEYIKALQTRTKLIHELEELFQQVDVIITPAMAITPPKTNTENVYWEDKEESILSAMVRYTAPFNMSGFPALAVNGGYSSKGLPIGLQLVGDRFTELELLRIGKGITETIKSLAYKSNCGEVIRMKN